MPLTVSGHSCCDALLEPAVLAPVPVDPEDVALLVLGARPVLDLLLDGATEEALETKGITKLIPARKYTFKTIII